jgi:hypothetical protein
VPSRDSPTSNRYKHNGLNWADFNGETGISGKCKIRIENKYSDDAEKEPQEYDVGGDIVDRKCKPPNGQNCCEVAEDKCSNRP